MNSNKTTKRLRDKKAQEERRKNNDSIISGYRLRKNPPPTKIPLPPTVGVFWKPAEPAPLPDNVVPLKGKDEGPELA